MARKHAPKTLSLEEGIARLRAQFGGRLLPRLDGLAYRFTIWLPIQARGDVVFTAEQRFALGGLLNHCFGGYSHSRVEGFPAWSGSWLPEGTEEPIVDHHIQLVVYTLQDTDSIGCMRRLKWLLQQEHVAAQEVVLIEQVPVQFVEAAEMS